MEKEKKGFFSSMRAKTTLMVVVTLYLVVVCLLVFVLIYVRVDNLELHENYMLDVGRAYGQMMEQSVKNEGKDVVLNAERLSQTLGDVSIAGMESSYAYVVGPDGTMLYHPTAEKIGQPVENEVVANVVNNIKAGKQKQESKVVQYVFKGAKKYAAYYVDEAVSYILVVTADKEDCLADIHKITFYSVLIGFLLLIAFCIEVFFLVGKMVKPIKQITNVVNSIAEMDFRPNEEQLKLNERKDESGQMSRGVDSFRENVKNVLVNIKNHSEELFKSSEELSKTTNDVMKTMEQVENAVMEIANGATSQANETQSATENVIVIGNMIQNTTKEVNKLHENALIMQKESKEATNMLKELNEINARAKEAIDEIYNQTNTTNQSAIKIKEAINLITSIAEETNLLSLNASIEAARAGEQGRGFAVVASQIQKLAEQSNESAGQIEQIVASLIKDSEQAVETMEEVNKVMEQQTENVGKTSSIFGQVQDKITDSVEGIDIISEHTAEMDVARVKVVEVVQNLSAIAQENAAGTEETSASVTEIEEVIGGVSADAQKLKDIATELEDNMKIFKL